MKSNAEKSVPVRHDIPPVFDGRSTVLILGSFPSVASREEGFFLRPSAEPLLESSFRAVFIPSALHGTGKENAAFNARRGVVRRDTALRNFGQRRFVGKKRYSQRFIAGAFGGAYQTNFRQRENGGKILREIYLSQNPYPVRLPALHQRGERLVFSAAINRSLESYFMTCAIPRRILRTDPPPPQNLPRQGHYFYAKNVLPRRLRQRDTVGYRTHQNAARLAVRNAFAQKRRELFGRSADSVNVRR